MMLTAGSCAVSEGDLDTSCGIALAGVGDANGDGYADVVATIVVTQNGMNPQPSMTTGLYQGGACGLASEASATLSDPADDAIEDGFGGYLASVGDVNGDGYADVGVAGSHFYVFLGGDTGFAAAPVATLPASLDDSPPMGLGDVNGDGYADIGVAEWGTTASFAVWGTVSVYQGSAMGPVVPAATTLAGPFPDGGLRWAT
jgi:hypothetical protein